MTDRERMAWMELVVAMNEQIKGMAEQLGEMERANRPGMDEQLIERMRQYAPDRFREKSHG